MCCILGRHWQSAVSHYEGLSSTCIQTCPLDSRRNASPSRIYGVLRAPLKGIRPKNLFLIPRPHLLVLLEVLRLLPLVYYPLTTLLLIYSTLRNHIALPVLLCNERGYLVDALRCLFGHGAGRLKVSGCRACVHDLSI